MAHHHPADEIGEIKTGDKVAFNFVNRATLLYYRILNLSKRVVDEKISAVSAA